MSTFQCPKHLYNRPCDEVHVDGTCSVETREPCLFVSPESLRSNFPFEADKYLIDSPLDWSGSPFDGRGRPSQSNSSAELTLPPDFGPERPIRTASRFERLLREDTFSITCEVVPPVSADATTFVQSVKTLDSCVDALQIADNPSADLHMSGLLAAFFLERAGLETILQMTCRDRNRAQLQADVLGASGAGIDNILCMTGAHPTEGNQPDSKPMFDLDSVNLINAIRQMRDDSKLLSGRTLNDPPHIFIGGLVSPLAPPQDYRLHDLGTKIAAGADFVVTHVIFDVESLDRFLENMQAKGLQEKVSVMVSIGVLVSAKNARDIHRRFPGVLIPESILERLDNIAPGRQRQEGFQIAVETIQRLRDNPLVSGINIVTHLSSTTFDEIVELCGQSNLLPRPILETPRTATKG